MATPIRSGRRGRYQPPIFNHKATSSSRARAYYSDSHNLAEGAGAAPLAALLQEKEKMAGRKVAVILSGGNVDTELYRRVLAQA